MILPKSFFDTTPYFGLSLSQASLKAVTVSSSGQILSYAAQPLSQTASPSDSQQLIQALEGLKAQGHFTTPYVSIVLPEDYAFSKEFSLPSVTEKELGEAISWQIEDIFPFSADAVYYDWKILEKTKEKTSALVVAIPKKRIDDIRLALSKVGLFPVSFEPAVSALSRISGLKDEKLGVLLEINQHHNSMSLIENGISILTTTGIIADNNQDLVSNVQNTLKQLINFYIEKKVTQPKNIELILTGDQAEENLAKSLQVKLNIPTTVLNVPNINPGFHAAYAAAASQIQPPEDQSSINLLPSDLGEWYAKHYQQFLQKKTFKIQAITLFTSMILATGNLIYLNMTQKQQTTQQATPPAEAPGFNQSQILQKANRITTLFQQKIGPQEELQLALSQVPPTIKIESMSYESSKKIYIFSGISQTREELIKLKENMENLDIFSQVTLPIGALTQAENVNFTLECTVGTKI